MSCIKSSFSSLRPLLPLTLFFLSAAGPAKVWSQAVPSQANIDASAQRRLQETAQEAQRQRRIEQQVRNLAPALDREKMTGAQGAVLSRRALAALARLRSEGISPDEGLARAVRSAGLDAASSAKPSAYLRNLFGENSGKITSSVLARLEAGEDPAPELILPPYLP